MRAPRHSLTENFAVFGYHVTGSTGTLVPVRNRRWRGGDAGALSVLLAGGAAHRAAAGEPARHELQRSQRETAFLNQERDQRLEHQQAGAATGAAAEVRGRSRPAATGFPCSGAAARGRQPAGTARVAGRR